MARGPIEDIHALTDMQRAMLARCVAYPDQPIYMGQWWALLEGALDASALCAAWSRVTARHTALRSAIHWDLKADPVQVVRAVAAFCVERLDWSARADWRADLDDLLARDRATPFDLKRPPLLRVRLILLTPTRHLLVWTRHHLVVDGWSLGDLLGEVMAFYQGREPPPALAFRRYVDWANGRALTPIHWAAVLDGFEPQDVIREPFGQAPDIAECDRELSADAAARLTALARQERLTLSTLVEGAWALALARAGDGADILFGSVETVRPPDLLGDRTITLIGPQIGILPTRIRIDATPLRLWLVRLQTGRARDREAGPIGLDAVRDLLRLPRDAMPLRSLLAVQTYPLDLDAIFSAAGLRLSASGDTSLPDMPLNLMVEVDQTVRLRLMFDRRHVSAPQADQYLDLLATALERMPDALDTPVDQIDILSATLAQRITASLTGAPLPRPEGTLVDLLINQIRSRPGAQALIAGADSWTYARLGALAVAVAARLASAGTGPGARVALLMDHGPQAIAALLGILCAGAAYVPLDPTAPGARNAGLLAMAGVSTLITSRVAVPDFSGLTHIAMADIVPMPGDVAQMLDRLPRPSPQDEAYVIFTSGSSGSPKGVSVGHDNLRYHVAASAARNADLPIARFLLTFPLFFDGSVTGLFCTLADGGDLVLPDPDEVRDPDALVALIRRARVTHVCMMPSLWGLLLDAAGPQGLPDVRMAKVAAEPCPPALIAAHAARAPQGVLCNEYGPTEATVWVSVERCQTDCDLTRVPIGRPLPGTRFLILDRQSRLCPFETIGELIVAGPAVARFYVGAPPGLSLRGQPEAIAEDLSGAPFYATGDRVSLRFDGRLVFHGRADRQIKLNGYRIEPGEIEAALMDLDGVREVALILEHGQDQPARLVAHISVEDDLAGDEILRQELRSRLPAYMIPSAFVRHARLPRTPAGKIESAALPPAGPSLGLKHPPQGVLETALARLWEDMLAHPEIGRHDDFFALGGSSLLAMRMIARLRRELDRPADVRDLFEAPSLAAFAARLDQRAAAPASTGPILTARHRPRVDLPS